MLLILFNKILGKRQPSPLPDHASESIEELVLRIQEGDAPLRNAFIADYRPYVAKVTSRFCKRYIDQERDDEFSISLAAFNEAINQFSPESGRSFLGFAETVMRRRLIDYVRKEQRFKGQIPYSSFEIEGEEDGNTVNPVEIHQAMDRYELERAAEERRAEIIEFSEKLQQFGISFSELAESSPKHSDSRESLFAIGARMSEDSRLMGILLHKRTLPIKELLELVSVSRKTLERNRKYIIAVALIHYGPYPYLQDYVHIAGKERRMEEHG